MAEPYLSELRQKLEEFHQCDNENDLVFGNDPILCKHFFSGAAAYVDGKIFMSLSPAGLALKLPQGDCDHLFDKGASGLRYFPKGALKKGYAVLPPGIVDDPQQLKIWIDRAIRFAQLPLDG